MKRPLPHSVDPYLRKRFDERAALFAKKAHTQEDSEKSAYIKFELQQESYGIRFSDCTQVLINQTISAVPFARSFITGVIQYDGAFVAAIDLLAFFGYGSMTNDTDQCVLMISHPKLLFGFLVNTIRGRVAYSTEQLTDSFSEQFAKNKKYIFGIHHGKTAILNIDAIAEDIQGTAGT